MLTVCVWRLDKQQHCMIHQHICTDRPPPPPPLGRHVPLSKIQIFLVLLLFHILLENFMQKQNGFGLLFYHRLTTVCFLMFLSRRRPNMARTSVLTNDYPVTLRLQPPGSPGLIPRPARVRWILSPSRVLIRKFSFKMQKPWKESHDHNNIATVCWPKSYSESIRFDLPF